MHTTNIALHGCIITQALAAPGEPEYAPPPPLPLRHPTADRRAVAPKPVPVRLTTPSPPARRRGYTTATTAPKFSYHIAASFIAKDRPYDPTRHVYNFNPYNRQTNPPPSYDRSSRVDSGHDSFFVSRVDDSGAVALGVADGVGGWVESGVDPADFAHGLCGHMATAARNHRPESALHRLSPRQLMQQGYDAVCRDRSLRAGGSTACIAVADPDGTLDVANLGDSGFLHLRRNAVHSYTEPQTHAFNTPYQLSRIPPGVAARMAAYGGAQLCDLPRDADVSQHELRHGDVLVFATDGVLDNLFNQDILRVASRTMLSTGAWEVSEAEGGVGPSDSLRQLAEPPASDGAGGKPPATVQSMLATQLVGFAKRASVNTRVDGPFAKEVQKYYPQENWRGGKVDDICVVVAVVTEDALKSKL